MQATQSITAHARGVVAVTEYLGGVVTAAKDGNIKYWTGGAKQRHQCRAHLGGVRALQARQEYLCSAGDSVKVWQREGICHEFEEGGVGCMDGFGNFGLVTGGRKFLKIWDLRMKKCAGVVSDKGPFRKCVGWDEVGIWTGSDFGINVRGI